VKDMSYSGAGFMPGKLEGTVLFNGACDQLLPQFSVVGD